LTSSIQKSNNRRHGIRGLYIYPWDLDPQNLESQINEIQELGVNTLTLACSYHAGKFISVKQQRVVFPQDGCIYFPAEGFGRLKPLVSDLTAKGPDLLRACCGSDIAVNAWTVLLHNTRLGQLHPQCISRNLFDDGYPYSLCPAHEDVQEYAAGICSWLTSHYELQALCLESPGWLPYSHGYHHEFAQVESNPWLDAMLALCFCQSCMAGASKSGVDMAGLRERLKNRVTGYLQSSVEVEPDMAAAWLMAHCREDEDLANLLTWRCNLVTGLVREIKKQTPLETAVYIIPTIQRPHAMAFWEGSDLSGLAGVCDGIEAPVYQNSPKRILADAWDVIGRTGDVKAVNCILRPGPPDLSGPDQVLQAVAGLREMGVDNISFYNYGMLRPHNLQWMKDALKQHTKGGCQ